MIIAYIRYFFLGDTRPTEVKNGKVPSYAAYKPPLQQNSDEEPAVSSAKPKARRGRPRLVAASVKKSPTRKRKSPQQKKKTPQRIKKSPLRKKKSPIPKQLKKTSHEKKRANPAVEDESDDEEVKLPKGTKGRNQKHASELESPELKPVNKQSRGVFDERKPRGRPRKNKKEQVEDITQHAISKQPKRAKARKNSKKGNEEAVAAVSKRTRQTKKPQVPTDTKEKSKHFLI